MDHFIAPPPSVNGSETEGLTSRGSGGILSTLSNSDLELLVRLMQRVDTFAVMLLPMETSQSMAPSCDVTVCPHLQRAVVFVQSDSDIVACCVSYNISQERGECSLSIEHWASSPLRALICHSEVSEVSFLRYLYARQLMVRFHLPSLAIRSTVACPVLATLLIVILASSQ